MAKAKIEPNREWATAVSHMEALVSQRSAAVSEVHRLFVAQLPKRLRDNCRLPLTNPLTESFDLAWRDMNNKVFYMTVAVRTLQGEPCLRVGAAGGWWASTYDLRDPEQIPKAVDWLKRQLRDFRFPRTTT